MAGSRSRLAHDAIRLLRGPSALAVAGFALVALAIGILPSLAHLGRLTVRTVVETSQPTTLTVYISTLDNPAGSDALPAHRESSVMTTAEPGPVTLVQLNFYGPVGDQVRLFSVQVANGAHVLQSFSAAQIKAWGAAYLSPDMRPGSELSADFVTTQQGSAIHDDMNVPAPSNVPGIAYIQNRLHRLTLGFWMGIVLAALVLVRDRRRWAFLGTLVISGCAIVLCTAAVADHRSALAPATTAVGRATYLGLSVISNIHALEVAYLLAILAGAGAAIIVNRMHRPLREPLGQEDATARMLGSPPLPSEPRPLSRDRAAAAIDVTLIASAALATIATFVPDVLVNLRSAAEQIFAPSYDSANALAWQMFGERGLVPMRDFWYPYGNSLFFQSHLVGGDIAAAMLNFLLVGSFAYIFWRLSGRSRARTWLATMGLLLVEPALPEFSRYAIAFVIPLLFLSLGRVWKDTKLGYLLFAINFGGGLFLEPDPVVYGCIGIGFVLSVEVAMSPRRLLEIARDCVHRFALLATLTMCFVLFTTLEGQFNGLLDIYGHSQALIAYSAFPTSLAATARDLLGLDGWVVWAPPLLLCAGLYLRISARSTAQPVPLARALIAVAGCSYLLIEKSLVRPIPDQLRISAAVAALLLLSNRQWPAQRQRPAVPLNGFIKGASAGTFAAVVLGFAGLGFIHSGLNGLRTTIADDLRISFNSPERQRLQAEAIAPARFADYAGELDLAHHIQPMIGRSHSALFVLGDDPIMYVLLDQLPPWTITAYNGSPMFDQIRNVRWLREHRPRVVVFDEATPEYDGVPSDVRVPLEYQAVISGYHPVAHLGTYDILAPLLPGEGPPVGFWVGQLGSSIDLGFIPDSVGAKIPGLAKGAPRVPYLVITARAHFAYGTSLAVPVDFGHTTFSVDFETVPSRTRLIIPLYRLWPWALSHKVSTGPPTSNGWHASIEYGAPGPGRLY